MSASEAAEGSEDSEAGSCSGLNTSPQKTSHVLTSGTCERDLVWTQSLGRHDQGS